MLQDGRETPIYLKFKTAQPSLNPAYTIFENGQSCVSPFKSLSHFFSESNNLPMELLRKREKKSVLTFYRAHALLQVFNSLL